MTDLSELKELKKELDRKIAEALEADRARQRAIEQERLRLQEAEVAKVKRDFQAVMSKYGLTPEDILGRSPKLANAAPAKQAVSIRKPGRQRSLTEIRTFFNENR
jgi:DNA-binding protein H-NS